MRFFKGIDFNFIKAFQGTSWNMSRKAEGIYFEKEIDYFFTDMHSAFSIYEEDNALLYKEEGFLNSVGIGKEKVFKEYKYLYDPSQQTLSVFFVERSSTTINTDKLFHTVSFRQPAYNESENIVEVIALGEHDCGKDTYKTQYKISYSKDESLSIIDFSLVHKVSGPKKDYTLETIFEHKKLSDDTVSENSKTSTNSLI